MNKLYNKLNVEVDKNIFIPSQVMCPLPKTHVASLLHL